MGDSVATDSPLVSVIVPIYNSENYLDECVRAVSSQTYNHLEIILVDDGSTDASGSLCERYAQAEARVKVLHKSNGGVSDARNAGLDVASGEYICFVDADDIALPTMVETLLDICLTNDLKMAQGRCVITSRTDIVPASTAKSTTSIYEATEGIGKTLYQEEFLTSVCHTLFHRSVFEGLRFRKDTRYEDLEIFYQLIDASGRVALTDKAVYLYRQHADSFVHKFNRCRADVLDVTDRMTDWIMRRYPELEEAARTRRLSANINIFGLLASSGQKMPDIRERCLSVIKSEGKRCRSNSRAKRSLRLAMYLLPLVGVKIWEKLLAAGYRRREKDVLG